MDLLADNIAASTAGLRGLTAAARRRIGGGDMRTTRTGEWYRLKSGRHAMSIWVGDDQVTYRALRGRSRLIVRKSVAGTERTTIVGDPTRTLREAKAIVQADWRTRLL